MEGEEVFYSYKKIKFLSYERDSEKLVVIFSGFNGPDAERQQSYNYIRSLINLNVNKLFILDNHGDRGSYYVGNIDQGSVEMSVFELIEFQRRKLEITRKNVILCGSSKGGSAALYFGLKYGYGEVISGAPQIKISDYLGSLEHTQETLSFITNDVPSSVIHLNSMIENQIQGFNGETKLNFFSSLSDWQYKAHLLPFLNKLDEKKITYSLEMSDYPSHSEVGGYFGSYLYETIYNSAFDRTLPVTETIFIRSPNKIEYDTQTNEDGLEFAYYFLLEDKVIEKRWYSKVSDGEIEILNLENKKVSIIVFVKDRYGNIIFKNHSV